MDTTVKRIRPRDYELSTVQENLATVLQQVLDYLNKPGESKTGQQADLAPLLERLRGPGTPQSLKTPALVVHGDAANTGTDVIRIGDPATATASAIGAQVGIIGSMNLTGPLSMIGILSVIGQLVMTGNSIFRPTSAQGVVIVPADAGVGFAVRNPADTGNLFSVSGSGPALVSSISSDRGFKQIISAGTYWNSAYTANTSVQLFQPVINANGGGAGTTPFSFPWPFPGSVLAISMNQAGFISGTNFFAIYKNGAVAYTWTAGAGGFNTPYRITFAKNAIPFAVGDVMTCFYSNSVSGNTQISAHLTLEMAA